MSAIKLKIREKPIPTDNMYLFKLKYLIDFIIPEYSQKYLIIYEME